MQEGNKPWWFAIDNPLYCERLEEYCGKYELEDVPEWEYVDPPVVWKDYTVIGDRHLPNGVRQHLVVGSVPSGTVVNNAHIIGEDDWNGLLER